MQSYDEESLSSGTDSEDSTEKSILNSSFSLLKTSSMFYRNLKKKEHLPEMSYELQQGFRILKELMAETNKGTNQYFMNCIEPKNNSDCLHDYYTVIKQPIWLKKIKMKFLQQKYSNITEFVSDLRLLFENCYRYYGPDHQITKKGVRLEVMMEQKLALLPRELRDKTSLEVTSKGLLKNFEGYKGRAHHLQPGESSLILNFVKHEKALRDKEIRKKQMEEKRIEKEEKEKEILEWEETLLKEPLKAQMKASWELPQIAQFFFLCSSVLQLPTISLYELERILLMPRESVLLHKIMSSLLTLPDENKTAKKSFLSYKTWTEKLTLIIQEWYNLYHTEKSSEMVFDQFGIEPPFFYVLGENNPLLINEFHELSFHQCIWLMKSLCDYKLHVSKCIQDIILEQPYEFQRETILGTDSSGDTYLYFPQFAEHSLRIYRQEKWNVNDNPLNYKISKNLNNTKNKKQNNAAQSSNVTENETSQEFKLIGVQSENKYDLDARQFELVADSIHSLEILINTIENKNAVRIRIPKNKENVEISMEKDLICSLKKLLTTMKQEETKLQMTRNRLRHKLYKEWKDFQLKAASQNKNIKKHWIVNENNINMNKQTEEEDSINESDDSYETSSNSEEEEEEKLSDSASFTWNKACKRKADVLQNQKGSYLKLSETLQKLSSNLKKGEINATKSLQAKRQKRNALFADGAAKGLLMSHLQQNTALQAKQLFAWETLRQNLVSSHSSLLSQNTLISNQTGSNEKKIMTINALNSSLQPDKEKSVNEISSLFISTEETNTLQQKGKVNLLNKEMENSNVSHELNKSMKKDSPLINYEARSFNKCNFINGNAKIYSSYSCPKQKDSCINLSLVPATVKMIKNTENAKPIVNTNAIPNLKTSKVNPIKTIQFLDKTASQKNDIENDKLPKYFCKQHNVSGISSNDIQSTVKTDSNNSCNSNHETSTVTAFNTNGNKQILLLQTNNPLINNEHSKILSNKEQITNNLCTNTNNVDKSILLLSNIKQNGKPVYFQLSPQVTHHRKLTSSDSTSNTSNLVTNIKKENREQSSHSISLNTVKSLSKSPSLVNHKVNLIQAQSPVKKLTLMSSATGMPLFHANANSVFSTDAKYCSISSATSNSTVPVKTIAEINNNPVPVFIQNSNQVLMKPRDRKDTIMILSYPSQLSQLNSSLMQNSISQIAATAPSLKQDNNPITIFR